MSKRRAIGSYVARACGLGAAGIVLFLLAAIIFMGPDGNTRPGVPDIVVLVFMAIAGLLLLFGTCSLLNAARMAYVLARHPWVPVDAAFSELRAGGTPNGQPVLSLKAEGRQWDLTLAALRWRWGRFQGPTLLFAGRPGHGGVVGTPDLSAIVWAGRSPFTRLLLGRRRAKG